MKQKYLSTINYNSNERFVLDSEEDCPTIVNSFQKKPYNMNLEQACNFVNTVKNNQCKNYCYKLQSKNSTSISETDFNNMHPNMTLPDHIVPTSSMSETDFNNIPLLI